MDRDTITLEVIITTKVMITTEDIDIIEVMAIIMEVTTAEDRVITEVTVTTLDTETDSETKTIKNIETRNIENQTMVITKNLSKEIKTVMEMEIEILEETREEEVDKLYKLYR